MASNGDELTSNEFSDKMTQMLYGAASSYGVGMGVEIGLFEMMASCNEPQNVSEISNALKCKERYVQELLGVLVVSGVIKTDKNNQTYFLPPTHREALLGSQGLTHLLFPSLAPVFKNISECFKNDGPPGATLENYEQFSAWRTKYKQFVHNKDYAMQMIDSIDIQEGLNRGIKVCEIGCHVGILLQVLAQQFPKSSFIGSDLMEEYIAVAKETSLEKGLKNINFEVQDVFKMPEKWIEQFDLVFTIDVIHDLPDPCRALRCIHKLLKPTGHFIMLENHSHSNQADNIAIPRTRLLYCASMLYCVPTALAYGGKNPLGSCIGKEKSQQILEEAGFSIEKFHLVGKEMAFTCSLKN